MGHLSDALWDLWDWSIVNTSRTDVRKFNIPSPYGIYCLSKMTISSTLLICHYKAHTALYTDDQNYEEYP